MLGITIGVFIVLCLITGYCGRKRKIGFLGFFMTPFILIPLIASGFFIQSTDLQLLFLSAFAPLLTLFFIYVTKYKEGECCPFAKNAKEKQ